MVFWPLWVLNKTRTARHVLYCAIPFRWSSLRLSLSSQRSSRLGRPFGAEMVPSAGWVIRRKVRGSWRPRAERELGTARHRVARIDATPERPRKYMRFCGYLLVRIQPSHGSEFADAVRLAASPRQNRPLRRGFSVLSGPPIVPLATRCPLQNTRLKYFFAVLPMHLYNATGCAELVTRDILGIKLRFRDYNLANSPTPGSEQLLSLPRRTEPRGRCRRVHTVRLRNYFR